MLEVDYTHVQVLSKRAGSMIQK